jgi:hypothetical protein
VTDEKDEKKSAEETSEEKSAEKFPASEKEEKKAEASEKKDDKKAEASEKKEEKAEEKKAEASEKKPEKKEEKPKKKKEKDPADAFRLSPDSPVANVWKTFLGVGLVGLAGGGYGYYVDHTRFAYAWLFGFMCTLTLVIGSILFVMMHHLASGSWGIVVRRVAEIFGASAWVLLFLVIPVVLMKGTLYGDWMNADKHAPKEHASLDVAQESDSMLASNEQMGQPGGGGGMPHGLPRGGPGMGNPHGPGGIPRPPGQNPRGTGAGPGGPPVHIQVGHPVEERALSVEHDEVMKDKTWYLSQGFFYFRLGLYFIVWALIGWYLLKLSTEQDKTKDPTIPKKLGRFSAPGVVLMTLTLTFAAFDWMMSLEPTWYSTIYGVIFFAGSMVCVFATLILVFLGFRGSGVLEKEVTVEHYHDLGKLLFGFMCFWAYVSFSQFMLQWYASIPEELTFYHHRWDNGVWRNVSLGIVLLHFILPFVFIMSRNVKRNLKLLQGGALLLLTMHVIDIYWQVMPNVPHQSSFSPHWIDFFCFLGPVGLFLAYAFRRMVDYPLVPVGDPRLQRSIKFVNA